MQKPIDALNKGGKKPGLEIWVVKSIKPPKDSFPCLFKSQPKSEVEYEVFSVPPRRHGVFHFDNLYIVLKTNSDLMRKDVHFWFGKAYKESTPSWINEFEKLELDWNATQHFEFQGYECELFESYFTKLQPAIRYKRGPHPDPSAEKLRGDTRFYKVEKRDKGKYRCREIPFDISLMTRDECFILDTDHNTRIYASDQTPINERHKSVVIANSIRYLDHESNGDIEIVDLTHFSNDVDKERFVKASKILEEGIEEEPVEEIDFDQPEESPDNVELSMVSHLFGDDVEYGYPPRFRYIPKPKKVGLEEKKEAKPIGLCARFKKSVVDGIRRILGREKKTETAIELPSLEEKFTKTPMKKPLTKNVLNSKKCYLLEGTVGRVYLWVGKASDEALREELIVCLQNEIRKADVNQEHVNSEFEIEEIATEAYEKKEDKTPDEKMMEDMLPRWTYICKITEGNEPVKFKRYFQSWE